MKHDAQKIYNFLTHYSRMPSYTEIAKVYGFKSKNAAFSLIKKFIEKDLLAKDKKGKLIPIFRKKSIPLLGSIQAGFPGAGEEVLHQSMSIDDWVIQDPDASYILQVEGDSMIDAGIHKGDYVIAQMTKDFKPGMIVVAEIDGEWTLKYLRTKGKEKYLEAANENYPDLFPEEELLLHAKVVSVVRKYE
jgi:repressor LexA